MGAKSYVEGWNFSPVDVEWFNKFDAIPDAGKYPHLYRWYIHIAALQGIRGLNMSPPVSAASPAAASAKAAKGGDDDDDFDVFGDDDDAEEEPKESRAEMLARLKSEAEARAASKEKKQRTLVSIEIKPWDVEQVGHVYGSNW